MRSSAEFCIDNFCSQAAPAQRQQNGKSAPKSTGQTNNPPDGAPDDQVNGAEEVEVSPTAVIDGMKNSIIFFFLLCFF